jgi:hypothetical protein
MKRFILILSVVLFVQEGKTQDTQEIQLPNAPPTPTASEQASLIEAIRNVAVQYTANLPNFICNETIQRQQLSQSSKSWKSLDVHVLEVTFLDGGDVPKLISINGKATSKTLNDVGGFTSSGDFGRTLHMIFNPKSDAKFRWERWTSLRGHPTHVFSYSIDKAHSEYDVSFKNGSMSKRDFFAWHGLVYVDRETQSVMRLTHETEGIPVDWTISASRGELDYDFAEIDGKRILLPVRGVAGASWRDGSQSRNLMEFSNYRQFSTQTIIRFEK